MICDEVQQRLSAHLDGDLASDEARGLEAHLRGCAVCRAELAALESLRGQLAALPDEVPPPDLWSGIEDRIGAAAPTAVIEVSFAARARALTARPAVRWALAAAAVLALAVAGTLKWSPPAAAPWTTAPAVAHRSSGPGDEVAALERECAGALAVLSEAAVGAVPPDVTEVLAAIHTVDLAITQVRQSLGPDPGAAQMGRLAHLWSTKLRLLHSAAGLTQS